jgi:hypothetical protein
MAAKQIAAMDFLGNPLLPGINNLRTWRNTRNLSQMLRFDGITQDEPHGNVD